MAKRWTKQKARSQKPRQRKTKRPRDGSGTSGAAGTMGGFRGGLKSFFGTGGGKGGKAKPRSAAGRLLDVALWGAVIAAILIFFSRRCQQ